MSSESRMKSGRDSEREKKAVLNLLSIAAVNYGYSIRL